MPAGAEDERIDDASTSFTPTLAVFHCRWCLPDSDYVRSLLPDEAHDDSVLLQLSCTARLEAEFAIKAFAEGYDGVLVLGCELGECHYRNGNLLALRRLSVLKSVLTLSGIYPERLGFYWVSPFDEDATRSCIDEFFEGVCKVGSFVSSAVWSKS